MDDGGLQQTTPPELPGFSVGRKLGSGSSADVWLAESSESGRRFAVKCFRPLSGQEGSSVGTAEEDIRREIRIQSVLDHQHLVKVHGVVQSGGNGGPRVAVLLDFAAGGSLAQLVKTRGRLTVGEAVTVLTPLAQALAYLHAKGFTHGDVSPGNVLFSAEGKPLLADVGIARMVGDPTVPHGGTPGFCDPAPVDSIRVGLQPERDLYSLAALGWYCLTGDIPQATRNRPPLPLIHPEIPAALAAALESGLHEDRRQRPTAASFATAVYRSAAPAAVGLSASVHPSVVPELLTRRRLPDVAKNSIRGRLQTWHRRLTKVPVSGTVMPHPHSGGRAGTGGARPLPATAAFQALKTQRPGPALTGLVAVLFVGLAAAAVFRASVPATDPLQQYGSAQTGNSAAAPVAPAAPGTADPGKDHGQERGAIPAGVEEQLESSDPALAVLGLAWLRSEAFRTGTPELLDRVNVAGSAAHAADAAIMTGLRGAGQVLPGFAMELHAISVMAGSTEDRAVVKVESSATSYRERSTAGNELSERGSVPAERLQVVLERDEGRWRVSSILAG